MEEALVAYLLSVGGLSTLVGTRINWEQRPQASDLPAITLTVVSVQRDRHYTGRSGLSSSRVQADCWGRTYDEAKRVGRALIAACEPAPPGFQAILIDSERDDLDDGAPGVFFRTAIDLIVWRHSA